MNRTNIHLLAMWLLVIGLVLRHAYIEKEFASTHNTLKLGIEVNNRAIDALNNSNKRMEEYLDKTRLEPIINHINQ